MGRLTASFALPEPCSYIVNSIEVIGSPMIGFLSGSINSFDDFIICWC